MHIKQAIEQQVDIICADINERNNCVEILEREGVRNLGSEPYDSDPLGMTISIGKGGVEYNFMATSVKSTYFDNIPAADFIASNTEPATVSKYTPAEIEYMDKVAIAAFRTYGRTDITPDDAARYYEVGRIMLEQKRLLTGKN